MDTKGTREALPEHYQAVCNDIRDPKVKGVKRVVVHQIFEDEDGLEE